MPKLFAILLLVVPATPSLAGDGVLEINQSCAANAGCFTGDAATFPVTITASGSYRLTSNLTYTDLNGSAIDVNADNVTVDLGGFTISGPANCTGTGSGVTCAGTGSGDAIDGTGAAQLVVRNGVITGAGRDGVSANNASRFENLIARGNGRDGFGCATGCIIRSTTSYANNSLGYTVGSSTIVRDAVASRNRATGIGAGAFGAVIRGCSVFENGGRGILAGNSATVADNSVASNGSDGVLGVGTNVIRGNAVYLNGDVAGEFQIDAGIASVVTQNATRRSASSDANMVLGSSGYSQNTVSGTPTVSGGIDAGGNVCGGTLGCP